MSLIKAKIGDVIYDVISYDEFVKNPTMYGQYDAIDGEDGYLYPIRSKADTRPGFYPGGGAIDFYKIPTPSESTMYRKDNIIDFTKAEDLKDVIRSQQALRNAEHTILTTIDNVFAPEIGPDDTPEMAAVKQAIIDKHIDLDKYEPRFGMNYNNDKRLLRRGSITFGKLRSICDALDMKATLVLEDAADDVPNPMGRVITAEITTNAPSLDEEGESE